MFAEDTNIWAKIRTEEDGISIQKDLDRLVEWSNLWMLKCNPSKCKVMHIAHNFETKYTMLLDSLSLMDAERSDLKHLT